MPMGFGKKENIPLTQNILDTLHKLSILYYGDVTALPSPLQLSDKMHIKQTWLFPFYKGFSQFCVLHLSRARTFHKH